MRLTPSFSETCGHSAGTWCKFGRNKILPHFAFTVGLFYRFSQPEILVMGLDLSVAANLPNTIDEAMRNGRRFNPGRHSGLIDDSGYRTSAHRPIALRGIPGLYLVVLPIISSSVSCIAVYLA